MKPFPTTETLQVAQKKHSLCHAKVSKVGKGFIQDGNDIVCPECARKKMIAEMEAENSIWSAMNCTPFKVHYIACQYLKHDIQKSALHVYVYL
jgi:hypothetical protein